MFFSDSTFEAQFWKLHVFNVCIPFSFPLLEHFQLGGSEIWWLPTYVALDGESQTRSLSVSVGFQETHMRAPVLPGVYGTVQEEKLVILHVLSGGADVTVHWVDVVIEGLQILGFDPRIWTSGSVLRSSELFYTSWRLNFWASQPDLRDEEASWMRAEKSSWPNEDLLNQTAVVEYEDTSWTHAMFLNVHEVSELAK